MRISYFVCVENVAAPRIGSGVAKAGAEDHSFESPSLIAEVMPMADQVSVARPSRSAGPAGEKGALQFEI